MYSYGSPHMAAQKQDDQLERTFSSYVRIQDVVLKTYLGRWTIGRSGERGSGISVLPARDDDDDDNCNTTSASLVRVCKLINLIFCFSFPPFLKLFSLPLRHEMTEIKVPRNVIVFIPLLMSGLFVLHFESFRWGSILAIIFCLIVRRFISFIFRFELLFFCFN